MASPNDPSWQGGNQPGGARGGGVAPPSGVVGILHVVGGNDRGKAHPLTRPTTTIGRGADQDCILADIAVSRRHVTISIDGNRYRLKDLGSGNGSLVNGSRIDSVLLNDGDQIEIGNSILKLEHAPSRAGAGAPPPMSSQQAPPEARTMMAEAPQLPPQPVARPAYASAPDPYAAPVEAPQMQMPAPYRPPSSALPPPVNTGPHSTPSGGLLDTTVKKIAVFGTIGLVVLLAGAVTVKKFAFGGKAEAQKLFLEGQKAYREEEFEVAKKKFAEALEKDPESTQIAKYLKLMDGELAAKNLVKRAQKLSEGKEWEQALKAIDSIDKSAIAYENAVKLRRAVLPQALKAMLASADESLADDPEAALTKIEEVLQLDPDSDEAQELEKKAKAAAAGRPVAKGKPGKEKPPAKEPDEDTEKPVAVAVVEKRPAPVAAVREKRPPPVAVKEKDKPVKETKKGKPAADDDDELATVSSGGTDALSIKGAAGPYKAKDFAGAAAAAKAAGKAPVAQKITALAAVYAKAEADKTKNASSAMTAYQNAMAIDASVGKSTHAAYFKAQIGKLAGQAAQQSFQGGKYEAAYEMVKAAQRVGASDGGVGAQLKTKAGELHNKATAMAKSNPNGAKTLWRQVIKMVPATDPTYAKAQQGLTATQSTKDDDED